MKRRTHGFTIVELLVVVSIIALLIAILLPAIGKARDAARQTQSAGNLRNLAVANNTYAACLLYTSPSPRDKRQSRMPSSA